MIGTLQQKERNVLALRQQTQKPLKAIGRDDLALQRSLGLLLFETRKELKKEEQRRKLFERNRCVKCSAPVPLERVELLSSLGKELECKACGAIPRLAVSVPVFSSGGYGAGREVKYATRLI